MIHFFQVFDVFVIFDSTFFRKSINQLILNLLQPYFNFLFDIIFLPFIQWLIHFQRWQKFPDVFLRLCQLLLQKGYFECERLDFLCVVNLNLVEFWYDSRRRLRCWHYVGLCHWILLCGAGDKLSDLFVVGWRKFAATFH